MLHPLTHSLSSASLIPLLPNTTQQPLSRTQIAPPHIPKPSSFVVRSSTADAQAQLLPKSAIRRIAEKLRTLGFADDNAETDPSSSSSAAAAAGEIFVPTPQRLPKARVGHTIDSSWSTPENPVPDPGSGAAIARFHELRNEVKTQRLQQRKEKKKESSAPPTLAELSLKKAELRRLTTLGIALRKKLKVGKAGITEGIVNGIHERWRRSEVVKIVCDDLCKFNMKRTHELLERKTGGLVVWRAGSKIILYRGIDYKYPYFLSDEISKNGTSQNSLSDQNGEDEEEHDDDDDDDDDDENICSSSVNEVESATSVPTSERTQPALIQGVGLSNRVRFQLPGEAQLAEDADRLLDGLGPRFTDWWGYDPLPVDADLLPAIIPGYRRPFRLLPYGVKPKLTDDEMTTLRRLGRPLPCHFALGRNRNLQGLASSIIKLWEKCEIAKIAIKRGVQNTNSEMMAEELKRLTGGTLLARDREFIVLYRGKDFLPPAVSSAIEQRRKYGMHREKESTATTQEPKLDTVAHGTEHESEGINKHNVDVLSEQNKQRLTKTPVRSASIKLSLAIEKREKAEKLLAELEKAEIQQQPEVDKEGITKEERYMLRKIGLKMKPFLLLGRRGVFDGTVENMHLHWKYRELIKIITNGKSIEAVHQVARTLEAESGGILVAVERVNKGYAIIVYRGKNYKRPASLRPKTLLNKRQAMKRSIEAQRRESLKLHVLKLNKNIDELKLHLVKDNEMKEEPIDESSKLVRDEIDDVPSFEDSSPNAELKSGSHHHQVTPAWDEDIFQATGDNIAHSSPVNLNGTDTSINNHPAAQPNILTTGEDIAHSTPVNMNCMDTSISDHPAAQQNKLGGSSCSCDGNETDTLEPRSSYESNDSESHLKGINSAAEAFVRHVSKNEAMESSNKLNKNDTEQSVPSKVENGLSMSSRTIQLSNKERLLLRKQALKMKKRPVLAVGKSNIVTGLAKAIKTHFKKHPLAIVNVKGRAKGTSVQEVVFKLEQETGAVLVSQEPSKVILYRGWGAGDTSERIKKNVNDVLKKVDTQPIVSPELLAAIKIECGLQSQEKEGASP